MNYTAFTAVIFTFHNLSAVSALIFALFFSIIFYGIFLRKKRPRLLFFTLTFIALFIAGLALAEKFFQKRPIGIEIIEAG